MRTASTLTSFAAAATLALLAQPAWAAGIYRFAGAVTTISNPAMIGGGLVLGDTVRMTMTLGPPVSDSDQASSVGSYFGAIESWTMEIGSFVTTGVGGDVLVCDSPDSTSLNCGSASAYPWWNGAAVGMDGVRFVLRQLSSPPIVLNGFTQACGLIDDTCGNANVYNDSATALTNTDIPLDLDPVKFSSGNGRVLFGPRGANGFVGFSMAVVPEPSTSALVALSLGVLGIANGRRRTSPSAARCKCAVN